jgi:hypothetical protein
MTTKKARSKADQLSDIGDKAVMCSLTRKQWRIIVEALHCANEALYFANCAIDKHCLYESFLVKQALIEMKLGIRLSASIEAKVNDPRG